MSKTEELLKKARTLGGHTIVIGRGNSKPNAILHKVGVRNGEALAGAMLEVHDEMSAYPPATAEEALAFCRLHIKRCNMNLANAKDRGDKRAIINLERKLAVYEYLYKVVDAQRATDCPNCLVHAVGSNGVCPVCGWKKVPACD